MTQMQMTKSFFASIMLVAALSINACGAEDPIDPAPTTRYVSSTPVSLQGNTAMISADLTKRFGQLALDCVHREYPNKISHVMQGDEDVKPPRELHPAFYGCFDWHSSVHGHWLLVRLLNVGETDSAFETAAREKLSISFTPENIETEVAYFAQKGRASYERPYGTAWLLQLTSELRQFDDPQAQQWLETLLPLEKIILQQTTDWLPKLAYPIRLGTHNQTAFAFSLMLDHARISGNKSFEAKLVDKIRDFHINDVNCPLAYEPSGEDFLSPCLMQADLMRRVMSQDDYAVWLTKFMPDIPVDGDSAWLRPGIVRDAADGKLVHLDGVNLSRAWNLYMIANALPADDLRRASLVATAKVHETAGIASVSAEHYAGSHWLASFATYLMTSRGQL